MLGSETERSRVPVPRTVECIDFQKILNSMPSFKKMIFLLQPFLINHQADFFHVHLYDDLPLTSLRKSPKIGNFFLAFSSLFEHCYARSG